MEIRGINYFLKETRTNNFSDKYSKEITKN